MVFPQPIPVSELAQMLGAELIGDSALEARGMNEIHHVKPGDVTFVDLAKYFDKALQSAASVIILNQRVEAPAGKVLLLCDQPFVAYNRLALHYRPIQAISSTVSDTAIIGEGTVIEPNAIIGPHVQIGKNCYIGANAYIAEYTQLGDRVLVQPGAIIGTEAFYFKKTGAGYEKWRSCGRVILEDDVEIPSKD